MRTGMRGTGALMGVRNAAVAAADQWIDPDDGIRYPAGEVHAWERGRNETVCGLALSKSSLTRFPHVSWADVQPESGRHAAGVGRARGGRAGGAPPLPRGPGRPPRRARLDADEPAPLTGLRL